MNISRGMRGIVAFGLVTIIAGVASATHAQPRPGGTAPELVATYESLADAILSVKATEAKLVRAILGAAYAHAQADLGRARAAVKANDAKAAQASLEALAAAVGQIGSEGDNAVAAVRKRLLEGGHHHNADGEAKGIFDEGFVIVTRAAKQSFLDSSRALGQLARAPKAEALEAEWLKVQATWDGLMKSAK